MKGTAAGGTRGPRETCVSPSQCPSTAAFVVNPPSAASLRWCPSQEQWRHEIAVPWFPVPAFCLPPFKPSPHLPECGPHLTKNAPHPPPLGDPLDRTTLGSPVLHTHRLKTPSTKALWWSCFYFGAPHPIPFFTRYATEWGVSCTEQAHTHHQKEKGGGGRMKKRQCGCDRHDVFPPGARSSAPTFGHRPDPPPE